MFIDMRRYGRQGLTAEQQDFLGKLVSFARLIQDTTYQKCAAVRVKSEMGICASLVMAHIIDMSNWGSHSIATKENNLSLLPKSEYWKGKSAEFGGVLYRSYNSWLDYSLDFTDELTFFERQKYMPLLQASNLDHQTEILSSLQHDSSKYRSRIEEIIGRLGLWEFDW